jgi:hypothetical protein
MPDLRRELASEILTALCCGTDTGADQDPRQFVPPSGQSFTTLREMREGKYENRWKQDEVDKRVWSIWTEPKVSRIRIRIRISGSVDGGWVLIWGSSG